MERHGRTLAETISDRTHQQEDGQQGAKPEESHIICVWGSGFGYDQAIANQRSLEPVFENRGERQFDGVVQGTTVVKPG